VTEISSNKIFITGGTGYIGRRLIPELIKHNLEVHALARESSVKKLPPGCIPEKGNALDRLSFANKIAPCKTFIQLIGVPHPSPSKKEFFKKIDLVSIQQSVMAAKDAGIEHFIYVSVAQGANVMKEYQEIRLQGEELIRESGMNATIVRPWYVVGPGHYWPLLFLPVYKILELIPATKEKATQLGLVSLEEMIATLVKAVLHPSQGVRVVTVPEIRNEK